MKACHRDVATESPGGRDQDSGRRVGVTPSDSPCWARAGSPNGPAIGEYWKSTRMPLQYAEKINSARSGMARAAKKAGRDSITA
jgi:hypothetical protein